MILLWAKLGRKYERGHGLLWGHVAIACTYVSHSMLLVEFQVTKCTKFPANPFAQKAIPPQRKYVQILHINANHWITVSNIQRGIAVEGGVFVYNSIPTKQVVAELKKGKSSEEIIHCQRVNIIRKWETSVVRDAMELQETLRMRGTTATYKSHKIFPLSMASQ